MHYKSIAFYSVMVATIVAGPALLAAQTLPAGPAKTIIQQRCTACHVATQFTTKHKTADQWSQTVETMIGLGAKIDDADFDKIVDYLTANYGVQKPEPAPPSGAGSGR